MKNQKIQYPKTSEILFELAKVEKLPKSISYGEILKTLGLRAFGILVIFFSIPSLLPFSAIPGISFLFSLPIAFFALEMILGHKSFWLPENLSKRTISRSKVSHMIKKVYPYLLKIEKFTQPRLSFMAAAPFDRMNALIIFSLCLLLMLPIPFSNFIIGSMIILISLGIMEKDGLLLFISYTLASCYFIFLFSIFSHAFAFFS